MNEDPPAAPEATATLAAATLPQPATEKDASAVFESSAASPEPEAGEPAQPSTVETPAAALTKRTQRTRRDRRRRKGQDEGANLTRLAALLGQIKEACNMQNQEGEKSKIALKVWPMIEAATKIVENLSQAQQKSATELAPGLSTPTDATVPTTSGSPSKAAKGSTEDGNTNTHANQNKTNQRAAVSRRLPRDLMPGTKIPPHFYKPQAAAFEFGHPNSYVGPGHYTKNILPPEPRPVTNKHTRETIKREKEQLEVRNDLRNARSVADYERVMAIAHRLHMDYEAQAAQTRIMKLQQAAAAGAPAEKVLVA